MPFFNITDGGCLINMGEEKVKQCRWGRTSGSPSTRKVFLPSNVMGLAGNGVGFAGQHASMRVLMLISDREPTNQRQQLDLAIYCYT